MKKYESYYINMITLGVFSPHDETLGDLSFFSIFFKVIVLSMCIYICILNEDKIFFLSNLYVTLTL